jgi:ribonuclease H / adenosylcobalamin/alpha-ribazole phosphatase
VVRHAATGEVLAERRGALGVATNNVAEYAGLIAGLRAAAALGANAVDVPLDSRLVVELTAGRGRVNHLRLTPLHAEAARLLMTSPKLSVWPEGQRAGFLFARFRALA